ncbi:MAG: hypothetical protein WCT16_04520 [Candidatus Buchananbacteria bacterium]
MIQKKISEAHVPDYAPMRCSSLKFVAGIVSTFGVMILWLNFAFIIPGPLYFAGIGWKLLSGVALIGMGYMLFAPPFSFWKEYYRRNIRGYILFIIRSQDSSDESFYLTTEVSCAFKKIDIEKDYYIILRLGGWFSQWRSGNYYRTFFCFDNDRIGDAFVSFGPVHLFFRYVDKFKSSINAPEGWLIEIRDGEGNRIICDWRKAFVLLREIRFSPKEFESGQSYHILFDVLTNFIKRSVLLASADREKKNLTNDSTETIARLRQNFFELLIDCLNGIGDTKRFIQSKEARQLRESLLKKWLPRMTWLSDWDRRRQELERSLKHPSRTGRSRPGPKPDGKDDPAEAEEVCSGCTLCGTDCYPSVLPKPAKPKVDQG